MDITLARLTTQDDRGNVVPHDVAWASLMSQLGTALAPPSLTPARTLGARQFYVGVENSLTSIAHDADYWQLGTRGDGQATLEGGNQFVDNLLNFTRLTFRKGLPFGIEVGAAAGHVRNTSLFLWSVEVRIALLEGFRQRWPSFLPDFGLRAAVHAVTGSGEFSLTVPTVEAVLSKPIRVGADAELSPFVSGQMLWIVAHTNVVHLARDPEGGPGSAPLMNQLGVFDSLSDFRVRMALGAQFRYRMFTFAGGFRFDVMSPSAGSDLVPSDVPRQWTLDLGTGVTY